jgi:thiamine-monophosphate kinase
VRLRIELAELPVQAGVREISAELGLAPWQLAATAGEDYELCFCASPRDRARMQSALEQAGGVGLTWIGEVVEGPPGVSFVDELGEELLLDGFEHRW